MHRKLRKRQNIKSTHLRRACERLLRLPQCLPCRVVPLTAHRPHVHTTPQCALRHACCGAARGRGAGAAARPATATHRRLGVLHRPARFFQLPEDRVYLSDTQSCHGSRSVASWYCMLQLHIGVGQHHDTAPPIAKTTRHLIAPHLTPRPHCSGLDTKRLDSRLLPGSTRLMRNHASGTARIHCMRAPLHSQHKQECNQS